REVHEELVRHAGEYVLRYPFVVAYASVRDAPQREKAQLVFVPAHVFVELRERYEEIDDDVGALGWQHLRDHLGEPQELRRGEELAEEQSADRRLGVDVGDPAVVAKE